MAQTERVIRAVVFDLFETLITEMPTNGAAARAPSSGAAEALGMDAEAFRAAWKRRKDRRMTSVWPYEQVLGDICAEAGMEAPESVIASLAARRRVQKAAAFSVIRADVLTMLAALRADGAVVAIASNCSVEEAEAFSSSRLATAVDAVIWSHRAGLQKPQRAFYELACSRLDVEVAEAMFVGDGSFDELDGARVAGLHPLWATWFLPGWPQEVAVPHAENLRRQGFQEASSPADVTEAWRISRR